MNRKEFGKRELTNLELRTLQDAMDIIDSLHKDFICQPNSNNPDSLEYTMKRYCNSAYQFTGGLVAYYNNVRRDNERGE